ncbi:hypothetical protein GCM10029992_04410 [Glycomyces albus]
MYTLTAENVVEMGTATKSNEALPTAGTAEGTRLLATAGLPEIGTSPDPTASEPSAMSTPLPEFLDSWLAGHEDEIVAARRHIHANPRLSRQEHDTADYVARKLRESGLKPQLIPDGTGLTCDIGDGERVIGIRADMDALPIQDPKDVPYRSTVDGVCHACGHDAHTALVLGVGRVLAELSSRGELPGRFRLIFQPSEEQFPSGAPTMIKHGALNDVAAIFAFHCDAQFPTGQIGIRNGPLTAACDVLEVRMRGRGGHTSRPHLTTDLINAMGRVIVDMPALVSRRLDPRHAVAIVFGAVQAGEAANAIPQEAVARATVRMQGRETWQAVPDLVKEVTRSVARTSGVECEIDYRRGVPRSSTTGSPRRCSPAPPPPRSGSRPWPRPPCRWAARTSPTTSSRCPARWPASASDAPASTATSTRPTSTSTRRPSPTACASWSTRPWPPPPARPSDRGRRRAYSAVGRFLRASM